MEQEGSERWEKPNLLGENKEKFCGKGEIGCIGLEERVPFLKTGKPVHRGSCRNEGTGKSVTYVRRNTSWFGEGVRE